MSLVVNLFGSPGSGKSTNAAGLFYKLKNDYHIDCELATEAAKPYVWQGHDFMFKQQDLITAMQRLNIQQSYEQVEVVVCDSPILLGSIYAPHYPQCYHDLLKWEHDQYNNLNFLVKRTKPYHQSGRFQDEAGSDEVYIEIRAMLRKLSIPFIDTTSDGIDDILFETLSYLKGGG